jgi:hypothetical protein
MPEERTIADQLHHIFWAQFGSEWRRDITLTLRADALYWLVFLAERGIEERRQHFKTDSTTRPAEAAASIASWTMDLEELLKKIEAVITPRPKGGKSS